MHAFFSNREMNVSSHRSSNAVNASAQVFVAPALGGGGGGGSMGASNGNGVTYTYEPPSVFGPFPVPNIGNVRGDENNALVYSGANRMDATGTYQRTYMTVIIDNKVALLNFPANGGNTFDFEPDGNIGNGILAHVGNIRNLAVVGRTKVYFQQLRC